MGELHFDKINEQHKAIFIKGMRAGTKHLKTAKDAEEVLRHPTYTYPLAFSAR